MHIVTSGSGDNGRAFVVTLMPNRGISVAELKAEKDEYAKRLREAFKDFDSTVVDIWNVETRIMIFVTISKRERIRKVIKALKDDELRRLLKDI